MIPDLLPGPWGEPAPDEIRCEFGICRRESEVELTLSEKLDPVRVCGIHIAPVIGWGVPEPIEPRIRYLQNRPESAA